MAQIELVDKAHLSILDLQEIDEGDQAILDSYMPSGQLEGGRTLADLIMEKIEAQNEQKEARAGECQ